MKIIYLTFLAGIALVAPLRAQTDIGKMSSQEFSQMLDRNLGEAKTEPAPKLTPAPVQSVSQEPVANPQTSRPWINRLIAGEFE